MIKQRYIRHEAINKDGQVVGTGLEVAGLVYGFSGKVNPSELGTSCTEGFIGVYGAIGDATYWKGYMSRKSPASSLRQLCSLVK